MKVTLPGLHAMAREGTKIAMLTCYDSSFAALLETSGVDVLLVGDSLGNVLQGRDSTLAVTMRDIVYHTECVARGTSRAFIVADMPFGSFQVSAQETMRNAARIMSAGAHMVKIEGGAPMLETIEFLSQRGVPVCGHLGLTPQSVHQLGGYKVQGKESVEADRILGEAKSLEQAGVGMLVLEAIPATLASRVTKSIGVPTIGIGAGPECSGQVLVLHDMLDIYPGRKAKFVKNFVAATGTIRGAIGAYVREVKDGSFPGPAHCF